MSLPLFKSQTASDPRETANPDGSFGNIPLVEATPVDENEVSVPPTDRGRLSNERSARRVSNESDDETMERGRSRTRFRPYHDDEPSNENSPRRTPHEMRDAGRGTPYRSPSPYVRTRHRSQCYENSSQASLDDVDRSVEGSDRRVGDRSRSVRFDDDVSSEQRSTTRSQSADRPRPPPILRDSRLRSALREPSMHSQCSTLPFSASTLLVDKDGIEIDVGLLASKHVSAPSRVFGMRRHAPYLFLSHSGKDAKEAIARPSHWFLTKILKVETFMDDAVMAPGQDKTLSLLKPAHECTHAIVVLSPSFRKSKYCIKELNTFMERRNRDDGITVIPALWRIEDVEGYAKDLNEVNWLRSRNETHDAADFLVTTLWPAIMTSLGRQPFGHAKLERILTRYVIQHRSRCNMPFSLERMAGRQPSICQCSIS